MSIKPGKDAEALLEQLERLAEALGRTSLTPGLPRPRALLPGEPSASKALAMGGLGAALVVLGAGIVSGLPALIVLGALLAAVAGVFLVDGMTELVRESLPAGVGARDPSRAHIGMGATVAQGARIEPGATVEMGATVREGAVVRRGAVVRMGATVRADAVIEADAVVGWGADVYRGAVVGEGAVVGAGVSVRAGARVPPGMRLLPGSTWAAGSEVQPAALPAEPAAASAVPTPVDPREARIRAACGRFESELSLTSEGVRAHLGASARAARALRDTSLGLLERERGLRAECAPEALATLEQEREVLQRRIAAATDARVRGSLEQALAALDDQRQQREQLRQSADRLDAELTRLMYTLDGMVAQLVRLRVAGQEVARAPDAEALRSMAQLREEIGAITEALEETARDAAPAALPEAVTPITAVEDVPPPTAGRTRERG